MFPGEKVPFFLFSPGRRKAWGSHEVGWLDGHMHWIWLRATGDARGDNQFWILYILPLQLRLFLVFHSWGQVYTATCHCMPSVLLSCLCSTPLQHSCSSSTHAGMNAHYVMRLLELDNQPLASTLRSHLLPAKIWHLATFFDDFLVIPK